MSLEGRFTRTLAELHQEAKAKYARQFALLDAVMDDKRNDKTAWCELKLNEYEVDEHRAGPKVFLRLAFIRDEKIRFPTDKLYAYIDGRGGVQFTIESHQQNGSRKYSRVTFGVLTRVDLDIYEPWRSFIPLRVVSEESWLLETAVQYVYCSRGLIKEVQNGNFFERTCKHYAATHDAKEAKVLAGRAGSGPTQTRKRKRGEDLPAGVPATVGSSSKSTEVRPRAQMANPVQAQQVAQSTQAAIIERLTGEIGGLTEQARVLTEHNEELRVSEQEITGLNTRLVQRNVLLIAQNQELSDRVQELDGRTEDLENEVTHLRQKIAAMAALVTAIQNLANAE